jgi:hypothetical protein
MAITVKEKFGRTISDDRAERHWIVSGTNDDGDARDELLSVAPSSVDGRERDNVEVEEIGHQLWLGIVTYLDPDRTTPDRTTASQLWSFDTTGAQQRITQNLQTVGVFAAPGADPINDEGAIGVDDQGNVAGVDIVTRRFEFTESRIHLTLSDQEIETIRRLTGTVNADSFEQWDPGEVLFLGARAQKRAGGSWTVDYTFSVSLNASNLIIGGIVVPFKFGWDYLDVRYRAVEDDKAGGALAQRPYQATVHRVYERTLFANLGL